MLQYDDSFVFLKKWHRVAAAFIAALTAYNYLLPWPPGDRNRFATGVFGAASFSLMAIFGNRNRGARLLSFVTLLIFIAALFNKLVGHSA